MKNISPVILCLIVCIACRSRMYGQYLTAAKLVASGNQVFLNAGLEPEWVTTLGYMQRVGKPGKTFDIHLGGAVKFAPFLAGKAWRTDIISFARCNMSEHWKTVVATGIYLVHDHNRAGRMDGYGFELRLLPVYYGGKWTRGFDVGWQYTFLTHLKHSEEARKTFDERYPTGVNGVRGPTNGWYTSTASRFRAGVTGARSIGRRVTLHLSAGTLLSVQKQDVLLAFAYAQVPFYTHISYSYSW